MLISRVTQIKKMQTVMFINFGNRRAVSQKDIHACNDLIEEINITTKVYVYCMTKNDRMTECFNPVSWHAIILHSNIPWNKNKRYKMYLIVRNAILKINLNCNKLFIFLFIGKDNVL